MDQAAFPIAGDLLEALQAARRSPFLAGLCRVALRAIGEGRDFVADLDGFLADYQTGMEAAGIDADRARTTLAELRATAIEEWNASRLPQARVVDHTLALG